MGGIGLGSIEPQPNTSYTHVRTQNTDNKIRTYNHTPQQHIFAHRTHTICTQYAHTQTEHRTTHNIRTQNAHRTQHIRFAHI